jgi:hypothetical protein
MIPINDLFQVFTGTTIDANFVNRHLKQNGILTFVKVEKEKNLFTEGQEITSILVDADSYEIANRLINQYFSKIAD